MINKLSIELQSGSGWVTVFPRGKHYINKYQMPLNCDDKFFSTITEWWNNSKFLHPFLDKNHEFDEKFGEFTEMRVTDKGLEMFLVLNEQGKELLKSGKYEYLSPTFNDAKDSDGKDFRNVIFTVSLVNYPALMMLDKIQNQIALSMEGDNNLKGGSPMDELRKLLAVKLGMSLAADDSSILAKIEALINSGITIEQLQQEIAQLKSKAQEAEMAAKTANDEKEKVVAELNAIKVKSVEDEANKVIDEAIKLGQYHPSLKEDKVKLFLSNPDMIRKELAVLPKKDGDKIITTPGGEGLELSAEDRAILEDAGYDLSNPEDIKLAKKFLMDSKEG